MDSTELYERQSKLGGIIDAPANHLGERESAILQWIRTNVKVCQNMDRLRVAELSVGDGQLSRSLALAIPSLQIDCVDISPTRLKYCEEKAKSLSTSVVERMRFMELNLDTDFHRLEREAYDIVIAIDILEHVFDPFSFVHHCGEMLTPNGRLFLRVPNLTYIKRRFDVLLGRLPVTSSLFETPDSYQSWKICHGWDGGHLHFFTIHSLNWLLQIEGLKAVDWSDVGARASKLRRIWPGMFYGNIAVVAGKIDTD